MGDNIDKFLKNHFYGLMEDLLIVRVKYSSFSRLPNTLNLELVTYILLIFSKFAIYFNIPFVFLIILIF